MREVKFRGLNANKEWVYGLISKDTEGSTSYYTEMPYRICWFEGTAHCNQPVITKSIGEFIGIQDGDGVDIYEGDLFQVTGNKIYQVRYLDMGTSEFTVYAATFILWASDDLFFPFDEFAIENGYVVGNIHETPELL